METLNQGNVASNQNSQPQQKPDNYLVWAILSTLLCCLPLGIVAIVKSTKVDSLWLSGNHAEAIEAAKQAKLWSMISAGVGLAGSVIYLIVMMLIAIVG